MVGKATQVSWNDALMRVLKALVNPKILVSVVTGLLVALIVIGAQCVMDSLTKHSQQEETKDFISEIENSVLDEAKENKIIAIATEARKQYPGFPVPSREQLRLERFLVALDSLELFLTLRTPLISDEDRFALLAPIIEARNTGNLFKESRRYEKVSEVAGNFFANLRNAVEWLEN